MVVSSGGDELEPPDVGITALRIRALEQKALSLDASGFIHKPIDREEIEKVLGMV